MRNKQSFKVYDYYYRDYIGNDWVEVSLKHVLNAVLRACPQLDEYFVVYVLKRDSDGHFFDFEVSDWVDYFKQKCYLKEVY